MKLNNILSLFDGMSCLQISLNRLGIEYDNYYSSEVDKFAIKATQNKFPKAIQLGDVSNIKASDLPKIDLMTGGFPCQSFSIAGKRGGFEDPRGKLFFELLRLKNELQPTYFLFENNESMDKKIQAYISRELGVTPLHFNSALVSAQNRERIYWTNINLSHYGLFSEPYSAIPPPKDKGILLKDILETFETSNFKTQKEFDDYMEKYYMSEKAMAGILNHKKRHEDAGNGFGANVSTGEDKSHSILSRYYKDGKEQLVAMRGVYEDGTRNGKNKGTPTVQQLELNNTGKSNTLTSVQKDNMIRSIVQLNPNTKDGFELNNIYYSTQGISPALQSASGSGRNINVAIQQKARGYNKGGIFEDKTPTLIGCGWQNNNHLLQERIRRLTPIECARLQTVPDDYFKTSTGENIISESQQYRCLGNGWTIDVICHILSYMK